MNTKGIKISKKTKGFPQSDNFWEKDLQVGILSKKWFLMIMIAGAKQNWILPYLNFYLLEVFL